MNNIPLKYQPQVKQLVNKAYARGFRKGQKSREYNKNINPEITVWIGKEKDIPKGWKKIK